MSKAKNYARRNQPDRLEWAATVPFLCMWCGSKSMLEIHEICRKSSSPLNWAHWCNYLLLCRLCHMGPFASMPHAKQLAVKLYRDKFSFDLDAWLRIRDPELKAPYRVTMQEVEDWREELFGTVYRS